jgi:hypothetical protein
MTTKQDYLKKMQEYHIEQLELAKKIFEGKRIKQIRYATEEETEALGWSDDVIIFETEDGTLFYPSQDSEGNGPGVMFVQEALDGPTMWHQF